MFASDRYDDGKVTEIAFPSQRLRFSVEDGRVGALHLMFDGEVRVTLPKLSVESTKGAE